jgi:hypothetical protein
MNHPEADLQIQVADLLRLYEKPRRLVFTSVPNELMGKAKGSAGLAKMARFRRMGLRSGVSDLIVVRAGRAYFLELKSKAGVVSDAQRKFMDDAILAGAEYAVARTFEQAVDVLQIWGVIP